MVREWIRDIRTKTADMDRRDKIQYIADYYWVHIALFCLAAGATILLLYNFTLGRQHISLQCAIVNAQTDDSRDEQLEEEIADALDLNSKNVLVDSAYQVQVQKSSSGGIDYSGYDKFFFELGNRELDIVILPESLMTYCTDLGEELNTIGTTGKTWVYLKDTGLDGEIRDDPDDPMVVIFPKQSRHEDNAVRLCAGVLAREE